MNRLLLVSILALTLGTFFSCNRDEIFVTDGSIPLRFSVDTLHFDTVFTEVGSATRSIKIFNDGAQPLKIGKVYLERGSSSKFRINVDGLPGDAVEEVIVYAKDSIYLFAEVTIDPDEPLSISPFIHQENLFFETNGQQQRVVLEAWGQNANYFPGRFNQGRAVRLTCDNSQITFDDPRPYVIYGVLIIDSCTVNIPAGTQIYVHGGIARNDAFGTFNDGIIITQNLGRIRARGTLDDPIVFQGDRLEPAFQEADGQWTGILLSNGSAGNVFQHTTVKNAIFGVYVDSAATAVLENTRIYNTSSSGIIGVHSRIDARNVLVYNNGANSFQAVHGGDYNFDYATLASYGVDASALGLSNFVCYDDPLICSQIGAYRLNARFRNSIIFGSKTDQILLSDITGGEQPEAFQVSFDNCVVAVEDLLTDYDGRYADFFTTLCNDCVQGDRQSILFVDASEDNYQLDSLSIALGVGRPIKTPLPIAIDLLGELRDVALPDAGCFERQAP